MFEQGSLLSAASQACERIVLPQAELRFIDSFLSSSESESYLKILRSTIAWEQSHIQMYGKSVKIPRLNAWYGDEGCDYAYSGKRFTPLPWTSALKEIRARVEAAAETQFNSVLLNCYRDGSDSVGWHSDDEKELGQHPIIASVSLGQTRSFHLRHKSKKDLAVQKIDLTSGSLLIMGGATQQFWQHQIPKTQKSCEQRINLTFRRVFPSI